MPDALPDRWALYISLVMFIGSVIFAANPKFLTIFGQWGEAMQERLDRQRSAAKAADDADIAERDRQIAYLRGVADERQRELEMRNELIREHAPWDWAMFEQVLKNGGEPAAPPPLIPYVPPPARQAAPETYDEP